MTVQYNQLVLTGGPCVFFRLLLRWRGCVLKLIYADLLIFIVLYYAINLSYRFLFTEDSQRTFEKLILFTRSFQTMIPVAFVLGFYINLVFNRFWTHFMTIPWGLKFAIVLAAHLPGVNDRACLIRRTSLRYLLGSLILTCTRLNVVAQKRFPTEESLVAARIFTEEELQLIFDTKPEHIQPFIPIVWTTSLLTLAEKEGFIANHHALALLVGEVNAFRQGLLQLFLMDHVCIPLVYTQVVTLAVYSYFAASLVGRQFIVDSSPLIGSDERDFYFPLFTIIEFLIYVGWLKVAETLVNPMGEDDEDLDINEVIDFNWKCTWSIIDGMHTTPPSLVRDIHWHQSVVELPHTEASKRLLRQTYRGSVFDLDIPANADLTGSVMSVTGSRQNLSRTSSQLLNPLRSFRNLMVPGSDTADSAPIVANYKDVEGLAAIESGQSAGGSGGHSRSPPSPEPQINLVTETIEEEDEDALRRAAEAEASYNAGVAASGDRGQSEESDTKKTG